MQARSSTQRGAWSAVAITALFTVTLVLIVLETASASFEGNSHCQFDLYFNDANDTTTATDVQSDNCWEMQAQNVSADSYHYQWWYYPNTATYGYWSPWQSKAGPADPVSVYNKGRMHYCNDPDQYCDSGYSTSGWYGNRDNLP